MIYRLWLILAALLYGVAFGSDYDRSDWGRFKKGVREKVIAAHSVPLVRCAYTGALVPAEAVQIDHIVPVAAAWRLGAHTWPWELQREFVNDPDNLAPVLAGVNASKGDKTPRHWMPKEGRDSYLKSWRLVCGKYGLRCDDEVIVQ